MEKMDSNLEKQPSATEHPSLSSMLLAGVQQMDPDSWSRLVSSFGPVVYRWCRSSGVAESDAPDIVQDVFASVARSVGKFQRQKQQGSFRSWLAAITRSRVNDYLRRRQKQQQAQGGTEALIALQKHAESLDSTICPETVKSAIVRKVLEEVRGEFAPATWQAFWMATIEGKPTADVVELLGMSAASVYQSKSRVLRRLRQRLSELPL